MVNRIDVHMGSSDQGEREALRDAPLLLPLVEQAAYEPSTLGYVLELTSCVSRLVAQHLPVTVISPVCWATPAGDEHIFADLMYATVADYLHQGFQHLLIVPWGGRRRMELLEPIQKALSAMTGEAVSRTELALPHVHVDGISASSVFGLSSIQTQLGPLLETFPGWDRTWIRLSSGNVKIVLLRSGEVIEQLPEGAGWEMPTMRALMAALCPLQAGFMSKGERSRRQRDGEIYARYLVSLLCAATEFFSTEIKCSYEEP